MSAYYHANIACHDATVLNENDGGCKVDNPSGQGAMRNYFAGLLFMLGRKIYLYKGYSKEENVALNFAGAFSIGVALTPMDWSG